MTYLVVVLLYLCGLVVVGAWHARRISSQEDFAVAGRRLTVPVLVGTMLATWIGTGTLLGNAEKTYETGIACIILPLGGVLGIAVVSMVASRVRRFEQITVQDILEARFGVVPRLLGTLAIITAYLTIVSYQYRAGGAVIHQIYDGWSVTRCSQVAAAFIIAYTVLAGMVSVARTDVVNGVIMTVGIAIALPYMFDKVGGIDGLRTAFADRPAHMEPFGPIKWVAGISLVLPAFLLVMGEANLYQRFFSARDERSARVSVVILIFAVAIVEWMVIFAAWIASALVESANPAHVLLVAARDVLPTFLGALFLAAAVAIIVSTADSFLLVVATSVVRDIYHRFVRPDATPKNLVLVSRVAVIVLGIIAYVISCTSEKFLSVALWAYTVYGASITPSLIATFFWKRATTAGATASITGGAVVTLAWSYLHMTGRFEATRLADVKAVIPAIVVSIGMLVIVSLLTEKPDPAKWKPFAK